MKVEIRQSMDYQNCWDLYVNGECHIKDESYRIVDGVRDSLVGGYYGSIMEFDEIAWSISRKYNERPITR